MIGRISLQILLNFGLTWHIMDSLFEKLDVTNDGALSRSDLYRAAKSMGWHWAEAPIFALLDLLAVEEPIRKDQFTACMQQVKEDPMGPYGRVLMNSAHFLSVRLPQSDQFSSYKRIKGHIPSKRRTAGIQDDCFREDLVSMLEKTSSTPVAEGYQRLLEALDEFGVLMVFLILIPENLR